jgi:hypothetical protein
VITAVFILAGILLLVATHIEAYNAGVRSGSTRWRIRDSWVRTGPAPRPRAELAAVPTVDATFQWRSR